MSVVTAFRGGAPYDEWPGPERLKLVSLAAGTFEVEQVLGSGQQDHPSWSTYLTGSPKSERDKRIASSPPTRAASDNNRSEWVRPWREGRRQSRWEKAAIIKPRSAPMTLSPREKGPSLRKRKVCVNASSTPRESSPLPGCATKYFGLVDGALAVISKVDQLEPRLRVHAITPCSWRVTNSPEKAGEGCQQGSEFQDAASHLQPLCVPYDRQRTAQEAPSTSPVEGPDPPPWSGSKFRSPRKPYGKGEAAKPLRSVTHWGSEMMRCCGADRDSIEGFARNVRKDDSRISLGYDVDDASLFLSYRVGSGPLAVSDDEKNEEPSPFGVDEASATASEIVVLHATTTLLPRKEEGPHRKRGRAPANSTGAVTEPNALLQPTTTISPGKGNAQEQQASFYRGPQPEAYSTWIPQHIFHGKALVPCKRWRELELVATTMPRTQPSQPCDGHLEQAGKKHIVSKLDSFRPLASPAKRRIVRHLSGRKASSLAEKETPPSFPASSPRASIKPAGGEPLPRLAANDSAGHGEGATIDAVNGESGNEGCVSPTGPLLNAGRVESIAGLQANEEQGYFDNTKRFSRQTAAEANVAAWHPQQGPEHHQDRCYNLETPPQAERGAATERTRIRSEYAAQMAIGRLRAPQSVFSPLHRTPSRPEMRRAVTHGRFSPVGRKLWRRSEGLFPRTGQLCLRAAPPPGRLLSSVLGAVDWAGGEVTPIRSPVITREERQWGSTENTIVEKACGDDARESRARG